MILLSVVGETQIGLPFRFVPAPSFEKDVSRMVGSSEVGNIHLTFELFGRMLIGHFRVRFGRRFPGAPFLQQRNLLAITIHSFCHKIQIE